VGGEAGAPVRVMGRVVEAAAAGGEGRDERHAEDQGDEINDTKEVHLPQRIVVLAPEHLREPLGSAGEASPGTQPPQSVEVAHHPLVSCR